MRHAAAGSLVVLVAATVVGSIAGPALAKLPPVDASAPTVAPVGTRVTVEMWFVDADGAPLPESETASWVPSRVGGWMWAYPARRGRPDTDDPGVRIPLTWRDGRYRGSFVPDVGGPWLVIPFGADHRMPNPSGPARPMRVRVRPIVGSAGVATAWAGAGPTWPAWALVAVGALGPLLAVGRRVRAR